MNKKKEQGCCLCGEKTICTLDFHHTDPSKKEYEISQLIKWNFKIDRLIGELDRCVVVCSNCHRKIHAGIVDVPKGETHGNQYQSR